MNILHTVESYIPAHNGMAEVVRQISERLVRRGHRIVVATSRDPQRRNTEINGVQIEEFAISGNRVHGIRGESERYWQFLLDSSFDVVVNFAAQQWATDLALPVLTRIRGKKVFVPTGFSALYSHDYSEYYQCMKDWMHGYDMNVFHSLDYRDTVFARQALIKRTAWIPNGAAEEEFCSEPQRDIRQRLGIPLPHLLVLHVGGFTGDKGQLDAIEIFCASRLTNATLLLVSEDFHRMGNESLRPGTVVKNAVKYLFLPEEFWKSRDLEAIRILILKHKPGTWLTKKKVLCACLSREETIAAYKTADVFLFPSHIECSPIVLFECMASKTPFVTTDVGNAREIVQWSNGGEIMPTRQTDDNYHSSRADIQGAVRVFAGLCQDKRRREEMAEAGYQAWKNGFTWQDIALRYEHLYESLLA